MTINQPRHAAICSAAAALCLAVAATAPAAGPSPKEQLMQKYPPRLTASAPASRKPVRCPVTIPDGGVTLAPDGLFRPAMDQNIVHLLETMSVDEPVKRWKGAQRGKSCEGNLPLRLAGTTHDRGLGTAAGTERKNLPPSL